MTLDLNLLRRWYVQATPGTWAHDDGEIFVRELADARETALIAKIHGDPYNEAHCKLDAFVATTQQRHGDSDAVAQWIVEMHNRWPEIDQKLQKLEQLLEDVRAYFRWQDDPDAGWEQIDGIVSGMRASMVALSDEERVP